MKGIVIVLALAVTLVSCQQRQGDKGDTAGKGDGGQTKLPPIPKVNTKEVWKKVKDAITSIKAKLSNEDNVEGAKEETQAQLKIAAEAFQESMAGIGNNIDTFASKLKAGVERDGQQVRVELEALGACGNEVLTAAAEPLSEVVGLLTKKGIEVVKKTEIPEAAPKAIVDGLKKLNATTDAHTS